MATDTSDCAPIGVFDSGLGGLSVLLELRMMLPRRDFIYVADSRHCPYGDRTPDDLAKEWADYMTKAQQKYMKK